MQQQTHRSSYTFGDDDRAAERLYWLARTFDPHTIAFIKRAVVRPPRLCIDLGAGPGYLSRSLHHELGAARTIGLEASARYVELGRRAQTPGLTLVQHDVMQPLPEQADLMVARFLLTHLTDPLSALCVWRDSAPLLLVLEELIGMSADLPVLTRYYELVAKVQHVADQDMHIGQRLSSLVAQAGFGIESHGTYGLQIPVPTMAHLHALNLPVLRRHAVVREQYAAAELDAMQRELEALAEGVPSHCVRVELARCRATVP
jgi:hypothetical protein